MRAGVALLVLSVVLTGCRGQPHEVGSEPSREPTAAATATAPVPGPDDTAPSSPPATTAPAEPEATLPAAAWSRRADAPVALTEVAAADFAGQLWVAGGFDSGGAASARVLIYDPAFDQWSDGPPFPEAVHHASLVNGGDALWLLGGYRGSGFSAPTASTWYLDPAAGTWVAGPDLPEARAAGAGAFDGSRVVYGGGVGPGEAARGDVYALVDGGWRRVAELSQAREHLGAASDGRGRVWFLGGRAGGMDAVLPTVDLLEGTSLRRVADLPTARGGVAGFWSAATGACLAGGEQSSGTFAEVECIRPDGSVHALPPLGVARHGLGAVVLEGIAYVALGGPEPGLTASAVLEALPVGP